MKKIDNYDVMFVYSEIQFNEDNEIARKIGKKFKPGKLYFGSSSKDYTKMIKADQYEAYRAQFPDVRIIAKGKREEFKFNDPKKVFGT